MSNKTEQPSVVNTSPRIMTAHILLEILLRRKIDEIFNPSERSQLKLISDLFHHCVHQLTMDYDEAAEYVSNIVPIPTKELKLYSFIVYNIEGMASAIGRNMEKALAGSMASGSILSEAANYHGKNHVLRSEPATFLVHNAIGKLINHL